MPGRCLEGLLRLVAAVVAAALATAAAEVGQQKFSQHLASLAAPTAASTSPRPTDTRVEGGADKMSHVAARKDIGDESGGQDGEVVSDGGSTNTHREPFVDTNLGDAKNESAVRTTVRTSNCSNGDTGAESKCEEEDNESGEEWRKCPGLARSRLAEAGFRRAVSLGQKQCARLWCNRVEGSEERLHGSGVYHIAQLGHVAEHEHECLLNISRMIVLHHSWPMCTSDFVCATNHSSFEMSAADCMPWQCWAAETVVLVFMVLVSTGIVAMSVVIMTVIIACPQFHKPKYYLRFSLAATDFLIGVVVCGHAAYNQWVGLTEIPFGRFLYYANLKAGQLFRHVPNCLWGVSDVLTQISGFFVSSNMIISLYTLSLMSLDRYLLLTRTHYRSLVTSRRVAVALFMSWSCGLSVPSLHFVYRPQKQHDICVNYDTSSLDVHIINNESKIATADYKVYLKHAVPLSVTVVVIAFPIIMLLVFSCRTLRKYNSYTRDRSVRQVKSALQLTQSHCSLSRQVSKAVIWYFTLPILLRLLPLLSCPVLVLPMFCCNSSPPFAVQPSNARVHEHLYPFTFFRGKP